MSTRTAQHKRQNSDYQYILGTLHDKENRGKWLTIREFCLLVQLDYVNNGNRRFRRIIRKLNHWFVESKNKKGHIIVKTRFNHGPDRVKKDFRNEN